MVYAITSLLRQLRTVKIFTALSLAFFAINPFCFMMVMITVCAIENKKNSHLPLISFFSMTLFACLVQMQRVWALGLPSDWNSDVYQGLFLEAGHMSFFEYVFTKKEPLWNVINYFGFYLTNGSAFHFFNGIAIITIVLTMVAIYRYWQRSGAEPIVLISSLAFVVFFVEYSSNLNNLLRSFFAFSVIVYVFVTGESNSRRSIYILLAASMIHTIGFIFLLLYLLKPLHNKLNTKQLLRILGVTLVVAAVFSQAATLQGLFSSIPFLGYAFLRLSNAANPHSFDDIIDPAVIFVNGAVVAAFALAMLFNKNLEKNMVFLANVLMILMLISFATAVIAPMIMTRIYISRFFIFPFVIPYVLLHARSELFRTAKVPYSWAIIAFFIYWFFAKFDSIRGGGFFPPINELITYSLFNFLF